MPRCPINPPTVRPETLDALADRLGRFDALVEVGIGNRPDLAAALVEAGHDVRATDVVEREVPPGVAFVVDDVTEPDPAVYADADAVYALNLPPELHRPALAVAEAHDAAFAFTTLGADPPAVDAEPETLPGETLFWASRSSSERGTE